MTDEEMCLLVDEMLQSPQEEPKRKYRTANRDAEIKRRFPLQYVLCLVLVNVFEFTLSRYSEKTSSFFYRLYRLVWTRIYYW